jgi:hypothetical protein
MELSLWSTPGPRHPSPDPSRPVTAEIADILGLKTSDGTLVVEPQVGSPAAAPGSGPSGADVPKLGLTLAPAGQVAGSGRRCISELVYGAAQCSPDPSHSKPKDSSMKLCVMETLHSYNGTTNR